MEGQRGLGHVPRPRKFAIDNIVVIGTFPCELPPAVLTPNTLACPGFQVTDGQFQEKRQTKGLTIFLEELVRRYSKPVYQGKRLRRMVELVEKSADMPVRIHDRLVREHRVDRRLSAETIAELVQAYRDGASTTELRHRYGIGQGSTIKILRRHGVEMRNQGLAESDVATAAELYRGGATLAQLGERFGISPNAVRRALVSVGVVMRARGGSRSKH